MSSYLKNLVTELERALFARVSSLDAHAHDDLMMQIENLKRAIDEADAASQRQLVVDGLNTFAGLLSVATNVMTLLK